jgi:hypothetical protein
VRASTKVGIPTLYTHQKQARMAAHNWPQKTNIHTVMGEQQSKLNW